ncbi:DUF4041 domain-containing protein [Oxalobacteraceae bacterium OTU3CINTB1]|nr:DUF4041 domain-containing protein [Oxalobacteraceae bacterium OTU3CINTB1]
MSFALSLICFVLIGVLFYERRRSIAKIHAAETSHAAANAEHDREVAQMRRAFDTANAASQAEIASLSPFKQVRDASRKAEEIRIQASEFFANAQADARQVEKDAGQRAAAVMAAAQVEAANLRSFAENASRTRKQEAESLLANAARQSESIVLAAKERAQEIAGDAFRALNEADSIAKVANAMRNVVEGYGDRYLQPSFSLLDDLAEEYGFEDAGQQLRLSRERTKRMVEEKQAAICDYVEPHRRDTAIRFVIDAFNGRVDSILSRVKSDNFGTLDQQIRDAYAMVNHNGGAFRNARVSESFLSTRLDELRYASLVQALKERDKEEQRRIREQIREEEKARREIERALRNAEKEEEALQKAMARVQAQVAKANDEQRSVFEAQLLELQAKLSEAESRGQRALSMAQQTKAGHVYVISNVGSFGEHMYKLGMTRRLEPLDRVKELGDASVPFSFDVHAMIWSEDAPRLEAQLHKVFVRAQVNKVNPRKEFFKVPLSEIRGYLDHQGVNASWTMAAIAAEFRETIALEKRLAESPAVANEWLNYQMAAADEQQNDSIELEVE